jgi:hypothetical protein
VFHCFSHFYYFTGAALVMNAPNKPAAAAVANETMKKTMTARLSPIFRAKAGP